CKELILSETVLDRVAEELDLDMSPKVLRSLIKVENKENSRILKISVTTGDPILSSRIANSIGDQGVLRVKEIMNVSQMSVYEYSEVSMIPSNDVSWQIPVLLGIVAAVLTYGICLLIMIFDDKINNTDDAENYLGLTVLGDIPHLLDDMKKKRGQNRYYGNYYSKYVSKSGDR
ncbi:MAG: hypothetical protein J6B12_02690, partial [Clostridia bacterium]|nr:hypothetical protein [Clostridia bacterium]